MRRYIWRAVFPSGMACAICIIAGAALCPHTLMPRAYGLAESTAQDGSNAKAVHELGETGQGINVGIISADNVLKSHQAFYDKDSNGNPIGESHVDNNDFSGYGIYESNHDTWMAGIVASRGWPGYWNDIGVAPDANICSAKVCWGVYPDHFGSFSWIAEGLNWLVNERNCRVIVTGIATGSDPNGQSNETLLYDYYAYAYNTVFANAAGNENTIIAVFGDAYNGITTGGLIVTEPDVYSKVGSASGSGPTSDGRRKPDLTAPAQNQTVPSTPSDTSWHEWTGTQGVTSLSGPHTAGVAALLLGLADDSSEPDDGHNEVIKAVIVNSTFPNIKDKSGNLTDPADPNNTWHCDRGYGRLDALRAYQLLNTAAISEDVETTQEKGWAYTTMTKNYEEDSYLIYGEKNERLVLTVTWNRFVRKVAGNYNEESAPKFGLDLTIKDPNGQTIITEPNKPNNLQKVDLLLAGDGVYEVVLKNATKKDRSYALAFELLSPIPGDFYPADYIVDYSDMATVAQQWLSEEENLEADLFIDDNNVVNLPDFAEFASHWLETDTRYYQGQ